MKSVILPSYNRNLIRAMLGLKIEETNLPEITDNDVVIKIHAAPVNPSDIAFMQGSYNIVKPIPTIPGFEASGVVVEAGKNAADLIGKKVSCFVQDNRGGTWSEKVIANKSDIIILNDKMDMDQAACLTVNPFTAYALFDIAVQYEASCVIQNAAGGQVAGFIRSMAAEKNIEVINIVRKPETASKLKSEGNSYVIAENSDDFHELLDEYSKKLNPTVAYDAVGGSLSGKMFNSLAEDSELVVYGGLSGKQICDINVMDVIFKSKIISGFNLMDWKEEIGIDKFNSISEEIQQSIISKKYTTKIGYRTSLDNIVAGLRKYIASMSDGKLLIVP